MTTDELAAKALEFSLAVHHDNATGYWREKPKTKECLLKFYREAMEKAIEGCATFLIEDLCVSGVDRNGLARMMKEKLL